MTITIQFQRPLQTVQSTFNGTVNVGFNVTEAGTFHIPLTFDNFSDAVPDLSITGIALTTSSNGAGSNTISGTAGKFNNVRVGDILSDVSTGTLTPKDTVARTVHSFEGLDYVVYSNSFTSSTLGVQAGDSVSGIGIPTNTVVDRIEYSTRRLFLSNEATATGETELTITPAVRVTAVRTSTAPSNPNQIEIDTTVATNGTNSTLTVKNGAREAVFGVLRLAPVNDSNGSRASFNIGFSSIPGSSVRGSANGLNPINHSALTFSGAGSFSFNGDAFLTEARVPRPLSA